MWPGHLPRVLGHVVGVKEGHATCNKFLIQRIFSNGLLSHVFGHVVGVKQGHAPCHMLFASMIPFLWPFASCLRTCSLG